MEITKELKEKLLNANSEEEVKALLGDEVTEEEAAAIWKEIEALKAAPGFEKMDDDELEAVNGGMLWCLFGGEYASDGKEVGCLARNYSDWAEAKYYICPESKDGHDWEEVRRFNVAELRYQEIQCKKCHYKTKVLLNSGNLY